MVTSIFTVLNKLFTRHLLTEEECSEVALKESKWEDHLAKVLLSKPAKVMLEACQVLEEHEMVERGSQNVKELKFELCYSIPYAL